MQQERRRHVRVMEQFIGKPFKRNGSGGDGYDCMGMIHAYLTEMGTPGLIESYQGITLENYTDFYLNDRARANEVLLEVFDLLGAPVEDGAEVAGDIVVIRTEETGDLYPAILSGNGNVLVAIAGSCLNITPLGKKMRIVKARRP